MSFGRMRAPTARVKLQNHKLVVGGLLMLAMALPVVAEDADPTGKAVPTSTASTKIEEATAASPTLVSANASTTLLPAGPEPVVATPPVIVRSEKSERSVAGIRTWQALLVAEHSAAVFDAWSTRRALTSGNGYERNPLMKPFANSATIYPATQAAPFLFDFLGYRMMRSQNRFLRRTWWLPQAASFAGSLWCGSRNLHVANLKH